MERLADLGGLESNLKKSPSALLEMNFRLETIYLLEEIMMHPRLLDRISWRSIEEHRNLIKPIDLSSVKDSNSVGAAHQLFCNN